MKICGTVCANDQIHCCIYRGVPREGHWRVIEPDRIKVEFSDKEIKPYEIKVLSCDGHVLKLEKN